MMSSGVWGVVDPGFKCIAFDLLAAAAMADVCVVMRHEGKGTGQIDRVPAAADVPVATEKNKQSAMSGEIQQPLL